MQTIKDYKLVKFLGKGTYGQIYLAQKENDPKLYAAKVLDKKRMDSPSLSKYFEGEIEILEELSNPYIVQFYEKLNDESNYYLIMEYCNGGNLTQNLMNYMSIYKETFNIEIIQHFMRQIISAFCHIHSKGIIHRDIKLENILLSFEDENDIKNLNLMKSTVKIIDFGVAKKLGDDKYTYTAIGNFLTMDPLILKKFSKAGGFEKLEGYNEKADVWSLGVIFYQLLTGQRMFKVNTMEEFMKKVEDGTYSLPVNKNFLKEAISFLNCMLQRNPEDRFSVQNLAQQDFIKKNVKDFTKADFKQIFHRIDKNGLKIKTNINDTIYKLFNNAQSDNYNEGSYSFNADIFGSNQNPNNIDNSKINTSGKDPKNENEVNIQMFTLNTIPELTKFEEELMETIKIDKGNDEKKKSEEENKEKDKKESSEIKEKINDEKEEAKIYIKGLLDEYKSAKEYFNKNGLTNKEKDAEEKCNKIQNCLENFEKGTNINFESLPNPITPEYIYNCPTAKRNTIFQEIISQYNEKKTNLEANIKYSILKYKKVDKETFKLIKNEIMSKLESEKKKVEKYIQIIELFQKRNNNIWTPAPEISKSVEMVKIEKITFEGSEYKLILHTTKNNYYNTNNRFSIRFNMRINNDKNYYGEVIILSHGDFEKDIIWNLKENEWNNLSNYFINVDFFLDQVFKGNEKINISKLKDDQQMKVSYPISFLHQQGNAFINFYIKIIMPEGKKITLNERKEVINIKKNYALFEGKSPYTNQIPKMFNK